MHKNYACKTAFPFNGKCLKYCSAEHPEINSTDYKKIIREEIENLTSKDVNILILLSHATFEENVHLADLFYELDVVVGGHGSTLLFNGINIIN